ncbi:hypothetical protein [Kitasatospora cineracea]|uniref:hypothetical protein n=1 Tax=Kitasatospora cineracea TaxID=88074 RepID=UPI0037881D0A
MAQLEGGGPHWFQRLDPLDALFLGLVHPQTFRDEYEFANTRDAWLRLLDGTVHGKGIHRFVREAVSASEELGLALDDGELMLALIDRLEAAGLDQRLLPSRLLPENALQGTRPALGPRTDVELPEAPENAGKLVKRFWKESPDAWWDSETPRSILRAGLHRLSQWGLPVEDEAGGFIVALYTALLANPGEPLEVWGTHAWAWALSLDESSSLTPVVDLLLVGAEQGLSVPDLLGRLFSLPAFTEPIPAEALLWTSSPGLALPRIAFGLGVPRLTTRRNPEFTLDELDWMGTMTRMELTDAGRPSTSVPPEQRPDPDIAEGPGTDGELGEEELADRRKAVRENMRKKLRKKSGAPLPASKNAPMTERIWNADGSSIVHISADSSSGKEFIDGLENLRKLFREKFGRDPDPEDPLFFDLDADEPTRLTKKDIADITAAMAERVAEAGIDPAPLLAQLEVGYMVTTETIDMFTIAEAIAFKRALVRHRRTAR